MNFIDIKTLNIEIYCLPTTKLNNTYLFNKKDGLKLIDICNAKMIIVIGIEGFKIEHNIRIPIMDCIVDFSKIIPDDINTAVQLVNNKAKEYLIQFGDNCELMEFVLCEL